jgi:hypothetical protein
MLAEPVCLLLMLYNHNSIYTWRRVVILREIAIQEVHPCLAGQQLNETRITTPDNSGALFDSRLGLTVAIRQAYFWLLLDKQFSCFFV